MMNQIFIEVMVIIKLLSSTYNFIQLHHLKTCDIMSSSKNQTKLSRQCTLHQQCIEEEYPTTQLSLPSSSVLIQIIRRENPMNKIQRIQQFLQEYQSLNPYLKNLLKDNYDDYQNELRIEFLKVSSFNTDIPRTLHL